MAPATDPEPGGEGDKQGACSQDLPSSGGGHERQMVSVSASHQQNTVSLTEHLGAIACVVREGFSEEVAFKLRPN